MADELKRERLETRHTDGARKTTKSSQADRTAVARALYSDHLDLEALRRAGRALSDGKHDARRAGKNNSEGTAKPVPANRTTPQWHPERELRGPVFDLINDVVAKLRGYERQVAAMALAILFAAFAWNSPHDVRRWTEVNSELTEALSTAVLSASQMSGPLQPAATPAQAAGSVSAPNIEPPAKAKPAESQATAALRARVDDQKRALEDARAAAAKARDEKSGVLAMLKAEAARRQNAEQRVETLTASLDQARRTLYEMKQQATSNSERLGKLANSLTEEREQRQQAVQSARTSAAELEQAKAALRSNESQLATARRDAAAKAKQAERQGRTVVEMLSAIVVESRKRSELETRLEALNESHDQAEQKVSRLSVELEESRRTRLSSEGASNDRAEQIARLQDELAKSQAATQDATRKSAEREVQIAAGNEGRRALESKSEKMAADLKAARDARRDAETKFDEAEARARRATSEIEQLRSQLVNAKAAIEVAESDKTKLETRLKERDADAQPAQFDARLAAETERRQSLQEKSERLAANLEKARKARRDADAKFEEATSWSKRARSEIEQLRSDLADAKNALKRTESETTELVSKLQEKEQAVSGLKQALARSEAANASAKTPERLQQPASGDAPEKLSSKQVEVAVRSPKQPITVALPPVKPKPEPVASSGPSAQRIELRTRADNLEAQTLPAPAEGHRETLANGFSVISKTENATDLESVWRTSLPDTKTTRFDYRKLANSWFAASWNDPTTSHYVLGLKNAAGAVGTLHISAPLGGRPDLSADQQRQVAHIACSAWFGDASLPCARVRR